MLYIDSQVRPGDARLTCQTADARRRPPNVMDVSSCQTTAVGRDRPAVPLCKCATVGKMPPLNNLLA